MKKTVKVNIGGFSYNIDEDAYNALRVYLDDIKVRLGNGNEAAETIKDIEERISELISTKITEDGVVNLQLVEEIIAQISVNPFLFPYTSKVKNLRRCVVSPQTTIYYRFNGEFVEIASFRGNKMNPKTIDLKE